MTKPLITIAVLAVSLTAAAQSPGALEGVYTEAQAASGKQTYDRVCGECHHLALKGTGHAPELAGPNFLSKWGERSVADVFTQLSATMPPTAPHSLPDNVAIALTAHILRVNGAAAGAKELRADSRITVGRAVMGDKWDPAMAKQAATSTSGTKWESWKGAGSIAGDAERAHGFVNREVPGFTPVTDAMLRDPPAADWLSWRRTLDGQGYSPLNQVTRRNVRHLRLAWVVTMHDGGNQATPLIHDGIMYLTHPDNIIQALD
ncbi:MAG: c-type cytochrome, partial [Steroidobacteraceae bacterium]